MAAELLLGTRIRPSSPQPNPAQRAVEARRFPWDHRPGALASVMLACTCGRNPACPAVMPGRGREQGSWMVLATSDSFAALGSAVAAVPDGPGVAAAVALIGILVVREIASALPTAQAVRWRRLLSFATLPLIILFSFVVVGKLASMRTGGSLASPPLRLQPVPAAPTGRAGGSAHQIPTIVPLTVEVGLHHGAPPVVHPGTSTNVAISAPAGSLVQVLLSFPGQQPVSFYDPTDSHGHLTLELRVPQHFALRSGHGDARIVVQTAGQRVVRVLHISAQPG